MENIKKLDIKHIGHKDSSINALSVTFSMRESVIRSAIKTLQLPPGSSGLDAGCGIGLLTLLLAEELGVSGHVTGLDLSAESLKHARAIAEQTGFSEQTSFQDGDVRRLPFDDNTFDWVWSADCVGYAPLEPLPLILELKRVVKPGGTLAILAWSSEKLLPGYPVLEARLNATTSGIAPFAKGKNPGMHFFRTLGRLTEAGLEEPVAETFAGTVHAPLSEEDRMSLTELFKMRWSGLKKELSAEEFSEFKRLCSPDSAEFIVNLPDYYAFFTYSMFSGRVAE